MAQDDLEQLEPEDRSIGGRLRVAREARGLSLQDIANQTRIPVRHLQHVEQEQWEDLPAITYCVGFVRAYGNAVGLDGAELGREIREQFGGARARTAAVSYYEPADPARVPPRSLAIVVALIAIAIVIGYLLWRSSLNEIEPAAPAARPPRLSQQRRRHRRPQLRPLPRAGGDSRRHRGGLAAHLRRPGGREPFPRRACHRPDLRHSPSAQRPLLRTGRPQLLRVTVGGRDLGPLDTVERTVSDLSLRPEDLANRVPPATAAPAR